jgi:hypothetical protein
MVAWVESELQKYGLSDTEDIYDPGDKRKISNVMAGNRFLMKLHHTAEAKLQGRATGGYTAEDTPAKGGAEGSKRVGMLELNSLLSHGAYGVIHDASVVRGQKNEDYWRQVMSGHDPPKASVPFVYRKFVNELKAAGINPVREGTRLNVMAMHQPAVDELVGNREIQNGETVSWKSSRLDPIRGGLFDKTLTGGHGGNRWSYIPLHSPMPNPIMEEPLRRMFGLTEKQFREVLAGQRPLRGFAGPTALKRALENFNVDQEVTKAQTEAKGSRKTYRDAAVRRLGYLKSAQRLKIHPKDWVLDKVPVLPPIFRPVSMMSGSGTPLVADPNFLYKELLDSNQAIQELENDVDDVSEERLNIYDSFKAVVGLGDPIQPRHREQKVRGILKHVFGSSPKYGTVQRKLLGSTVDLVGRAAITPNPDLDMDQVGLPIDKAWTLYRPFIVRRLVRRGMPRMQALQQVQDRSKAALHEMQSEMQERPLIVNRAPTLHRYGVMAFWPQLTQSDTLEIPPLVTPGFTADFDGDAMQFHVPATAAAVRDATQKMLPSRNLYSAGDFGIEYAPTHEYLGGLWSASTKQDKKPPRVFRSRADAVKAYRRGEIGVGQAVEIMET